MDDRTLGGAPRGEQRKTVGVNVMVPAARPGRRVECLLHVDGKKGGAIEIEIDFHDRRPYSGIAADAHKIIS
jgi:hypothetical protein